MTRHTLIILLLSLISLSKATAQSTNTPRNTPQRWESIVGSIIDEEGDEDTEQWEMLYDALYELEQNPIDVNSATKDDLQRIPFLTANEISDILEYIYRNGPIVTNAEFAMIRSLSAAKRNLLSYFITIRNNDEKTFPKLKNIIKHGKNELIATGGIPMYERKGDKNGYLGYKYRHSLRYDHTYGKYMRIGFVGAQDCGEPFFADKNKMGYDFYSYYASINNLGKIKSLIVGRYRIRMGMGLIMNNELAFGKSMYLTSINRQGTAIRPHSSRSSQNFMQGAAASVSLSRRLTLTAFASYRNIDATLNKKDGSITTILTSGYHRTETEMAKKNNASEMASGGNIEFSKGGLHAGISAYYATLDKELKPNTSQSYRKYYASGRNFYNLSADYGYSSGRISLQGETATGNSNALATVNMIAYRLKSNFQLTAIQRFYSYKYYSLFSQSFSDGGNVQNESGLYLGMNWQPMRAVSVVFYSDIAYFPWAKYQVSSASHSFDNMLSVGFKPGDWTFFIRYRLKMKEKDNANKSALIYQTNHTGRMLASYSTPSWNVKAQFDISSTKYKDSSFGYLASISCGCTTIKKLNLHANFGYFHTKDYNSRIYLYERGMLYDFASYSFYGEGIRYSLLGTYKLSAKFSATAKAAVTNYFNRSPIGSGLQQVDHSSLCDINMQIKWVF